jgi:hypothetical protein
MSDDKHPELIKPPLGAEDWFDTVRAEWHQLQKIKLATRRQHQPEPPPKPSSPSRPAADVAPDPRDAPSHKDIWRKQWLQDKFGNTSNN